MLTKKASFQETSFVKFGKKWGLVGLVGVFWARKKLVVFLLKFGGFAPSTPQPMGLYIDQKGIDFNERRT